MSNRETPTPTDLAAAKLMDNGWTIKLWKNPLGNYTSQANSRRQTIITDHFTAGESIQALADKVFGCGFYGSKEA